MFNSVAIVGCGLIGGSLALAIHRAYPNCKIYGISRRLEHIKQDKKSYCFEALATTVTKIPQNIELVIVCTPIETTVETIQTVAKHVSDQTVITDVASVKEYIVTNVTALNIKQDYIPGHPMAGKETTGFNVASADLFDNAPYFLIPVASNKYIQLKEFFTKLNCNIVEVSAPEHDQLVAYISHVPYLTAAALTQTAISSTSVNQIKACYGPGFKDSTRVAASAPNWALDISKYNKKAIIEGLSQVIDYCSKLKQSIQSNTADQLLNQFEQVKSQRDQLNRST